MFAGRYKGSMDKKGRVVIPKPFREAKTHTVWTHGVLTSGLDGCLSLYTFPDWEQLIQSSQLKTAGLPDVEMMLFQRLFAGSGHVVEVDQFSRIVVPQELREEAELAGDCVWIGALNRAELWSADRWQAYRKDNKDKLKDIWDQIAQRGRTIEADTNVNTAQEQTEARE